MFFLFLFLFVNTVSSLGYNNTAECNEKILFVLDRSPSIGNTELYNDLFAFKRFKREVNYIIKTNTHIKTENIAVLDFHNNPRVIVDFNTTDREYIKNKVKNLKQNRNVAHTNLYNALDFIENKYIKQNYNILDVIFFTDTQIGNEFNQPDYYHYNIIKSKINNKNWNNDFIKKIVYYSGQNINNSVLDLLSGNNIKNQYEISKSHYRVNCTNQRCIDYYCIKKPLEHHLICLNYSKYYKLFNSHCHFFCSNIDLVHLNNIVDLEYCFRNQTINTTIPFYKSTNTSRLLTTLIPITNTSRLLTTLIPITNTSRLLTTLIPITNSSSNIVKNTTVINNINSKDSNKKCDNKCTFIIIIISIIVVFLIITGIFYRFKKKGKKKKIYQLNNQSRIYINEIYSNIEK